MQALHLIASMAWCIRVSHCAGVFDTDLASMSKAHAAGFRDDLQECYTRFQCARKATYNRVALGAPRRIQKGGIPVADIIDHPKFPALVEDGDDDAHDFLVSQGIPRSTVIKPTTMESFSNAGIDVSCAQSFLENFDSTNADIYAMTTWATVTLQKVNHRIRSRWNTKLATLKKSSAARKHAVMADVFDFIKILKNLLASEETSSMCTFWTSLITLFESVEDIRNLMRRALGQVPKDFPKMTLQIYILTSFIEDQGNLLSEGVALVEDFLSGTAAPVTE